MNERIHGLGVDKRLIRVKMSILYGFKSILILMDWTLIAFVQC